ncbi:hypothetical protein AAHA92_09134 [Salvia divinorum]|uniref:Uncharacterized protein n=1 Tax=Salvia divinorum TaxID=28513 RepID=A0ABD1HR75_SALDI
MADKGIVPYVAGYNMTIQVLEGDGKQDVLQNLLSGMLKSGLKSSDQRLSAVIFFNLIHQMERMQSEYSWDFNDLCYGCR